MQTNPRARFQAGQEKGLGGVSVINVSISITKRCPQINQLCSWLALKRHRPL